VGAEGSVRAGRGAELLCGTGRVSALLRLARIVLSFLYWSLRRLLALVVLRFGSEREKEIEILLLRHQLRVLERQVGGLC
jgi:hypothetical protein